MRYKSYEIYKNPTNREISNMVKETNGKIRILIDEENKGNWYMFPSNFLHQYALNEMLKEDVVESRLYRSGEAYVYPDKIDVYIFYGSYKLQDGSFDYMTKDYNEDDYKWLLDKFKFFNTPVRMK